MKENIVLKNDPKIEFQFLANGFRLIDGKSDANSGYYAYRDLESIELNKTWFPRLANVLRTLTWVLNGVPYFPDAESCKKSNIIIHFKESKLGIWLTDSGMASNAKKLKAVLDRKTDIA